LAVFQVDRIDNSLARNTLQRFFDDVGFGRVHQDWRGNTRSDLFQDGSDVALFIFTHNGAAQIEHVRAVVHELLRQLQDVVVLLATHEVAEMFYASRRVHLLSDDQRLGIKVERYGRVRARGGGRRLHIAPCWLDASDGIHNGFQVLRGRTAASADNADTVVFYEVLVVGSQFFWFEFEDGDPAHVFGQASVGQDRNLFTGVRPEIAHRIVHLGGSRCAIQSNEINVERFEGSQRCANLSAQQHGS